VTVVSGRMKSWSPSRRPRSDGERRVGPHRACYLWSVRIAAFAFVAALASSGGALAQSPCGSCPGKQTCCIISCAPVGYACGVGCAIGSCDGGVADGGVPIDAGSTHDSGLLDGGT